MNSIVTSKRRMAGRTYSLPAALARRDPKGLGVLFDLRAYTGFLLRLHWRDAGFRLERIVGHRTEPFSAEVRLDFLTEDAARDPRHLLAPLVESVPREALAYLATLPERQIHALRMFGSHPPAVDLIRSSPHLLRIVIAVSEERGTPVDELRTVLGQRRHELLGWCGGLATKAAVRYLERRQISELDGDEVRRVLAECASPAVIRDTAQVPAPDHLSSFFPQEHPELLQSEGARRSMDPGTRTMAPLVVWMRWRDTLRMVAEPDREDIARRLRSCRSEEGLQQVHDEVLADFLQRQPEPEPKGRRLPPPPLEGTAEIQPLSSAKAMDLEGRVMKHCCGGYVRAVKQRSSYLYRVLSPERATLELDLTGPEPQIAQLQLAHNGQPRPETFAAVASWLARRIEERRAGQQGARQS